MEIKGIQNTLSFGRAYTTKEKKEWQKTAKEAQKQLGLGMTVATVFDFSVPKTKNDTGIGTSFSKDAQELGSFLNTMCGVNCIQLQPQNEVSNYVRSPYSGTSFSLGMHLIDLDKLQDKKYGSILKPQDMQNPYFKRVANHDDVDYDNVFAEDGQKAILKKAYLNFKDLDKSSPLKKEFEAFKKENIYWLEKDALFEATAVANKSKDLTTWSERDRNVFATPKGDTQRIAELKKVTDENSINIVDFEEFVQFIADKQQKESKAEFNAQGIELMGDAQIGFSQKDFWAHKSAFYPNYEFGCRMEDGNYSCWSPAFDYSKLNGEAGELLFNKFNNFFKRYDGVRIDAAWQFVDPLICEPLSRNDKSGNKLGRMIGNQPVVGKGGRQILEDIILKAADKNKVPHDKIFLELLGGPNAYHAVPAAKALKLPLIHITRYREKTWGRVTHYEAPYGDDYQKMKPGEYIIGPGTHDDNSLIDQITGEKKSEHVKYLAEDLHLNEHELDRHQDKLSDAAFAELFTTKHQFATLPDILGSERRINVPNTTVGNWIYRAPQNYEQEYYTNLSQGKGLNTPEAYRIALRAKNSARHASLIKKLEHFANILREDGPMTTKDADAAEKSGKLNIRY